MDVNLPLPLLGGLSPQAFMRRHWQRRPLLIRQAVPDAGQILDRRTLFALAGSERVESRLVVGPRTEGGAWKMRHGPLGRRALPPLKQPAWTLLVQGVDLHHEAAHRLLQAFRFVPDARLDDAMVSFATDGGGVGPHFDSYDVFLLQIQGRRRWRIGRQKDLSLREGLPLKILRNFEPDQEFVLDAGDMIYLPPQYAHDGVAIGDCMTLSVGFQAPARGDLAAELLQRMAQDCDEVLGSRLYQDRHQEAVHSPSGVPPSLQSFAAEALQKMLGDPVALARALGEYLTEPKAQVWFDAPHEVPDANQGVRLDRKTRMMHDQQHVFINGEAFLAGGRDAHLMRRLADDRELSRADVARASAGARALLLEWRRAGWLHGC